VGERRVLAADVADSGFEDIGDGIEGSESTGSRDAESDTDVPAVQDRRAVTVFVSARIVCQWASKQGFPRSRESYRRGRRRARLELACY
jgi:hypothetical protein